MDDEAEAPYHVGDRLCAWLGDGVYCGTLVEIEEHAESTWLEVDVDAQNGQPLPPYRRERHPWTFKLGDDLWLERDGPSTEMRAKILRWYGDKTPEALLGYLS